MHNSNESAFLLLFSRLNAKLTKRVDGQLSAHGISFTEYLIMHYLEQAPNQTLPRIQLAESIGISASGVTRLLAPMEKNNVIEKEKNPRDARMSLVKLSETGQRLYSEATVTVEHSAKAATERLSASQLNKLLHYLQAV